MVKCDTCGKECKTAQGLAGHRQFVHGQLPGPQLRLEQPNPLVTQSELEQRLRPLESKLGFTQSELEQRLGIVARPITKQVQQQAKQLKELREQFDEIQKQLKHAKNFVEQLTELRKLLAEAVSGIGEDKCLLLLGVRGHKHDPGTGDVTFTVKSPLADRLNIALEQAKAWESIVQVAEMFEPARGIAFLERLRPTKHPRGKV